MDKLTATVVITTKNRQEELLKAVASAMAQRGLAEVIVIDDGSSDGTSEAAEAAFHRWESGKVGRWEGGEAASEEWRVEQPSAADQGTKRPCDGRQGERPELRVVRHEESKGLIVRRNEATRIARGDVIFSIDDDAVFSSPCVVEQTLREFSHPRIGAVAIPCIEPQLNNKELQRAPSADRVWVTANFKGTAHAVRRDVFLAVGGYREELLHQGEEGDFCVRMLAASGTESAAVLRSFGEPVLQRMGEGCLMSDVGGRRSEVGHQMADSVERSGRTKGQKDQGSNDSLLDAVPGFFVRMGNSDPIIHNESVRRDYSRMDFYGRRNDILFHWQNTPMPDLLWTIPATIVGGLVCAAKTGRWRHMLRGIGAGLSQSPRYRRCPLPQKVCRTFKELKKSRGTPL